MLVKDLAFIKFDGGNPPTGVSAKGVAVARTGAGVYTLTLGVAVDADSAVFSIGGAIDDGSGAQRSFNIFNTSDTVKTLFAYDDAGAATDTFTVSVLVQSVAGGGIGGG